MSSARRAGRFLAAATGAAILLTACGATDNAPAADPSAGASAPASGAANASTITHTFEQEISSYNAQTAEEYSSKNHIVLNRVLADFWYYGADGSVTPDKDMGTYEKTSDDPLTVKYTINPNAVWSDGNAIACDDVMLTYAAASGKFPEFSYISTTTWDKIKMPDCKIGDKEVTLNYTKSYGDWAAAPVIQLPAHIVAQQGGLSEQELFDAIKAEDHGKLKKAAEFFNKGWIFNGKLPDKALIPSSGQYVLDSFSPGQSITLARNEKFWGEKAKTEKIVIRFIAQDQQVQALQNGETNIIEPQSNPDVLAQVQGLQNVTVKTGEQFLYDHLDFNFNKGPFKDAKLRQAIALCAPRQQIVDNLIKPQNPNAAPMNVRNIAPFQPGYAEAVTAAVGTKYDKVDLEGAKKLVADSGVKTPIKVNIGYNQPNPRRTQVVELIKASCDQVGFQITDTGSEKFFDDAGDLANGNFDIALFGWAGSSLNSGWTSTYQTPTKCTPSAKGNNKGCYSNKEYDKLAEQILAETDPAKVAPLIQQVEKILWDDLATIPLYSQPALSAWSSNLQNIQPNPSQASITWNMQQWAAQ
ncbi:ABC transporter family substrate-binding protein [Nonomuraea sp. NPDC004354]